MSLTTILKKIVPSKPEKIAPDSVLYKHLHNALKNNPVYQEGVHTPSIEAERVTYYEGDTKRTGYALSVYQFEPSHSARLSHYLYAVLPATPQKDELPQPYILSVVMNQSLSRDGMRPLIHMPVEILSLDQKGNMLAHKNIHFDGNASKTLSDISADLMPRDDHDIKSILSRTSFYKRPFVTCEIENSLIWQANDTLGLSHKVESELNLSSFLTEDKLSEQLSILASQKPDWKDFAEKRALEAGYQKDHKDYQTLESFFVYLMDTPKNPSKN